MVDLEFFGPDVKLRTFVTAGVSNSTACILCRAGAYWTGSGWQSFTHDDSWSHSICLELNIYWCETQKLFTGLDNVIFTELSSVLH